MGATAARRSSPQLRFVDPAELVAREVLARLWPRVESAVGRSMTQTAWRAKNKRAALDMARAGLSADQVAAAHEALSAERGGAVAVLAWVQEHYPRLSGALSATARPPTGAIPAAWTNAQ